MPDYSKILEMLCQQDAWGNSVLRWLVVLLVALAIGLALRWLKRESARHASNLVGKGAKDWSRVIETLLKRTKTWFLFVVALYGGSNFLALSEHVAKIVDSATVVVLLIQAAIWINGLLVLAISRYTEKHKETDAASVTTLSAIGFFGRLTVWATIVLLAMANLGINVTAMIAGLGIGGVAVALAAQNILGDLFASVSIILDKPFVLGDFIIVDDKMGSVEYIGLKTTRLRSLSGEQVVFSNTDLLKSRIHNYKRMYERRVLFTIGVTYNTPYEQLAAIPAMLRTIIESQQPVRFDRAHFARYGDSAIVFEMVYYVLAAEYNVYMDVQQAINLAIFRRFAEEKIEFAFPSRTVYLHQ